VSILDTSPSFRKLKDALGLKQRFSISLSDADWQHILLKYHNDDFKLIPLDASHFKLVASESVGTVSTNQSGNGEEISLNCHLVKTSEQYVFNFSAPISERLLFMSAILLFMSPFIMQQDLQAGLLCILLSGIVFFWFRAVYQHQQKSMIRFFHIDLKKYLHFKAKGHDYFSRRQ
jgi:hypothetical protein